MEVGTLLSETSFWLHLVFVNVSSEENTFFRNKLPSWKAIPLSLLCVFPETSVLYCVGHSFADLFENQVPSSSRVFREFLKLLSEIPEIFFQFPFVSNA